MALVYTYQPGNLNFADNPILVRVRTDLQKLTFLRIVLTATFTDSEAKYPPFTTRLSMFVEDKGEASFNLSDAARTLFYRRLAHYTSRLDEGFIHEVSGQNLTISCREHWLTDGITHEGDPIAIGPFRVVNGGLTELERATLPVIDPLTLFNTPRALSRKPADETVYRGQHLILPMLSAKAAAGSVGISVPGLEPQSATYNLQAGVSGYAHYPLTGGDEGPVLLRYPSGRVRRLVYRSDATGVRFLRIMNSFGMIEDVAVHCNEALEYNIESETFHTFAQPATRPEGHLYLRKSSPLGAISLSSGPVNTEWGLWFIQEVLTTPIAWLWMNNQWVPGVIEADDHTQLYDRSKPAMLQVEFTFRHALSGVQQLSF